MIRCIYVPRSGCWMQSESRGAAEPLSPSSICSVATAVAALRETEGGKRYDQARATHSSTVPHAASKGHVKSPALPGSPG